MSKSYKTNGDKPDKLLPVTIDSAENARRVDEAEQIEIFSIDGTAYTMAKAERSDIALTYLEYVDAGEDDRAAYYLLTETLGEDAYAALKGVRGLTGKQFDGVLTRVQSIALPKARSTKRPRR